MIEANPTLYTPACEDQGIDVALALMLLAMVPATRTRAAYWVAQASRAIMISYTRGSRYPVIETDYATLINMPDQPDEERRKELTAASILQPLLAAFAHGFSEIALVAELGAFQRDDLAHANYQTWVPNVRSEPNLWVGRRNGSALGGLTIGDDGAELISALRREVDQNQAYDALSAITLGHWPMLLLACGFYRLPPPPELWLPLVDALTTTETPEADHWEEGPPRSLGGRARARLLAQLSTSPIALMHAALNRAQSAFNFMRPATPPFV